MAVKAVASRQQTKPRRHLSLRRSFPQQPCLPLCLGAARQAATKSDEPRLAGGGGCCLLLLLPVGPSAAWERRRHDGRRRGLLKRKPNFTRLETDILMSKALRYEQLLFGAASAKAEAAANYPASPSLVRNGACTVCALWTCRRRAGEC